MKKSQNITQLQELAKKAALNSYAPYSKFNVGAALEDTSGKVFSGCNVENLAFPSGVCAERTAIFKAVSEVGPAVKIKTIVVYTQTKKVTTPCGACRQVINEFAQPDTRVVGICDSEAILDIPFRDLLPRPTEIDELQH